MLILQKKKKLPEKVCWKLEEKVFNTYKFFNHDINKFISLLQIGVYSCKYICEISLPKKEDFYIHLDLEDITDADYVYAKRFAKILK